MLRVIDNEIHLTRGDSAALSVNISARQYGCNNKSTFELSDGDEVFLTVKKTAKLESFVFQKRFTSLGNDEILFRIEPLDTNELDFGTYVYDVEIRTVAGDVYTIITPSNFIIEPEVTYAVNEGISNV